MLDLLNLDNVLFIDVETAPMVAEYKLLPENYKKHWDRKTEYMMRQENVTPESIFEKAGIFSEFAKVICVSTGVMRTADGKKLFRIKSFYGDDEKTLLEELCNMLNTSFNRKDQMLCGHNVKEFDIPFLSRRMLVKGIKLPSVLDLSGKKPWEVPHIDTMEQWKFGDYKNYTSLELLATLFDIPSPKDEMDGSDVARMYWKEKKLDKIVEYCQKDVLTVAQLMLRFQGKPLIKEADVTISK